MRIIICLFIYMFICSCFHSDYYGYVYDFDTKKPLESVKISDLYNTKYVMTDKNGYFKIEYTENISTLLFQKKDYNNDTILSFSIQSGEFIEKRFKGEKIYLFHRTSNFRDSINKLNKIE